VHILNIFNDFYTFVLINDRTIVEHIFIVKRKSIIIILNVKLFIITHNVLKNNKPMYTLCILLIYLLRNK